MHITVPTQLFMNGKFMNSESGRQMDTINPGNEEIICQVKRIKKTSKNYLGSKRVKKRCRYSR